MLTPRIIALCGKPKAGKSTAADLLKEAYGYHPVDDGAPLREIAMKYFDLTHDQVHTQAGKAETVTLNNKEYTVREILGELENAFEEKFGVDVIPLMSSRLMKSGDRYVLSSVRREQGHFWSDMGALVIEIDNPDAEDSEFEFDQYSKSAVHHTIINDGLAEGLHEDDALLRLMNNLSEVVER